MKTMKYGFVQALQHTALVKIASTLWNQDDIRSLVEKFVYQSPNVWNTEDKEIENRMIEKISRLPLPKSLEKKLIDLVKPIGLEILKWRQYHVDFLPQNFVELSLDKLCWTQQGTVDKKKTAEVLVQNENTDIIIRYTLACIYCLEQDIPILWGKIPQNCRKYFYSEKNLTEVKQLNLKVILTYDIKGEMNILSQWMGERSGALVAPYRYAFGHAVHVGNKAAAEYFLQKLTPEERKESLKEFARDAVYRRWSVVHNYIPKDYYSDVLCFLLSQMTEEQQTDMFRTHSCEVLKCFLDWPLQSLFMRMTEFMWTFLSKMHYYHLLCTVVEVIHSCKYFNYREFFGELWQQSPNAYKKYVINRSTSTSELLSHLFRLEDKNNIWLILKDANVREREEMIFCYHGKNICKALVYRNKWDLVKFFVEECISSRSIWNKFKKDFKRHVYHRPEKMLQEEKDTWNKFFKLLLDFNQKDTSKRNMTEENNGQCKRLCNKNLEN